MQRKVTQTTKLAFSSSVSFVNKTIFRARDNRRRSIENADTLIANTDAAYSLPERK
jgi:hypothetical protein